MAYKNSPEQFAPQHFADAKRDWHNWTHTLLSSHAMGYCDPILCEPLTGHSTVKLDAISALQTNPTLTPLFDSAVVTDAYFFVPQRVISRGLMNDNFMELDEIDSIAVPCVNTGLITTGGNEYFTSYAKSEMYMVTKGSVLNRLGVPACIMSGGMLPLDSRHLVAEDFIQSNISGSFIHRPAEKWNMSPLIAYYQICERFFSNPYDVEIPIESTTFNMVSVESESDTRPFALDVRTYAEKHNLFDVRDTILALRGTTDSNAQTTIYPVEQYLRRIVTQNNSLLQFGRNYPIEVVDTIRPINPIGFTSYDARTFVEMFENLTSHTGIWPARYNESYQTLYFDNEDIDDLVAVGSATTSVNANGDPIADGVSVLDLRLARGRMNKMFRAILRGKRWTDFVDIVFGAKLKMCDHPIFVGSNSYPIVFDDVINQSAGSEDNPLGTASARGKALKDGMKEIVFTTDEPGYLIGIRTIVPNISYAAVTPRWLSYRTMSSFPQPQISGTAFQDLRVDDVVTTYSTGDSMSIGKQPIYSDYMKKYNRLQGVFATKTNESYTFKRESFTEDTSTENLPNVVGSTFVTPSQFNYAFANVGGLQQAENYFIKTQFKLRVFQPIDRQVLSTY